VCIVVIALRFGKESECTSRARSSKVEMCKSLIVDCTTMTDPCSFTVILAVIVAATAMTTIAPQIITLTKASSSAEELFRTIDRTSEIDPLSEEGQFPATCEGVIEIKDIAFAYPARPDIPVLKGLTLSAPAHKTTALVGASGSGKSTIIGLIGTH
jgi:ATP-binding cassette subfamily B (MDR/TAP) protein 1